MKIKYIPNVFDKSDRQELEVEYKVQSVAQILKENFNISEKGLAPIVTGKRVDWDFIPCKDDEVIYVNELHGGGGVWLCLKFVSIPGGALPGSGQAVH